MRARLNLLGTVLAVFGLLFLAGGAVAFAQVQDGYDSLAAFSEAQNVTLSYDEDGQLIDRGEVEGAEAIMQLLTGDWGYKVDMADFDPADPVVNTDSEYMFQMATIGYHILNGTQTVVLTEAVEYEGETFEAGTYEVPVDGRYWTGFDRMHPLDGKAREQAWSGTAHGLFAELGVGTVTHSALQMGLGIAALLAGLGGTLLVAGLGLVFASRGERDEQVILMGDTAPAETEIVH
ncbi:MAG: hypothetical protein ACLGIR_00380 [Actinomycetes bacterium]